MKNYAKIDHINRYIIMDRAFARSAAIVGTEEYNKLQQARCDYPEYQVVQRTIQKNPYQERYGGLTYAFMEDYILTHEPSETAKEVLDEFMEMRLISKCHSKAFRYPVIKKWFLNRYPEIVRFGMRGEKAAAEAA